MPVVATLAKPLQDQSFAFNFSLLFTFNMIIVPKSHPWVSDCYSSWEDGAFLKIVFCNVDFCIVLLTHLLSDFLMAEMIEVCFLLDTEQWKEAIRTELSSVMYAHYCSIVIIYVFSSFLLSSSNICSVFMFTLLQGFNSGEANSEFVTYCLE